VGGRVAVIVNTSVKKAGAKWTNSNVPCNPIPDNLYALSVNGLNIEVSNINISGINDINASKNVGKNYLINVRTDAKFCQIEFFWSLSQQRSGYLCHNGGSYTISSGHGDAKQAEEDGIAICDSIDAHMYVTYELIFL
jgi:hypothetical protein